MACPACGADNPGDARFCASCGYALQEASSRAQADERRVATVLFADIVGFTALSESSDPEAVKNLVDSVFERLVSVVASFGGKVDKIIGDAIVALFGAPVAHEDDAERAVRAALRMQQALVAHTADTGADVQMRIGVNTGEVVVGALRAGGDYTAMGDVVNTASRLQTAADPGAVLVGPATHSATQEVIEYEAQGLLQAKGRDEPVDSWVAIQPITMPGYRARRLEAPIVGRQAELAMMSGAIDLAVDHERAQLILLIGDAGVGKTRLAGEAAALAEATHDVRVLEGRCLPYGEANVWWPVAEPIRQVIELDPDASAATARARTRAFVSVALEVPADHPDVGQVTEGLLYLMDHDSGLRDIDPQRARDEATAAVIRIIEALAHNRPAMLVFSDLHWADDVVLDMADQLMERLGRYPYLLVATARPELLERWTPKPGRHNVTVVHIDPLDRDSAALLLTSLLDEEADSEVRDLLLSRSGGNPFYLEELVALMDDSGQVPDGTPVAGRPELPGTLRGLVAARIDGLTGPERHVLDEAAIWGRRGPVEALERMAEAMRQEADISDALKGLVDQEILVLDGSGWAFRNDLTREVAYDTLTKAHRARGHAGIAGYMDAWGSDRELDDGTVQVLANHYGKAAEVAQELGDLEGVPDDVVDRALAWSDEAVERSRRAEYNLVTIRLYDKALGLVGTDVSPRRIDYLLGRATALAETRDLDAARADIGRALAGADQLGDSGLRGRALLGRGDIESKEGDAQAAVTTLNEAIALLEGAGDQEGSAEALRLRGMAELFAGDRVAAEASMEEALGRFRAIDDRRGVAWALQNLAWSAFEVGHTTEARERLEESAATFEELGDTGGLGWALGLLAWVKFHEGEHAEAEELAVRMTPEARARGDKWAEGMMQVLVSSIRLWSGRAEEAVEPAEHAVRVLGEIGDPFAHPQALGALGRILVARGRFAEAKQHLALAVRLTDAHPDQVGLIAARLAAVAVGDVDGAALVTEELDTDTQADHIGQTERIVGMGLTCLQAGEADLAVRWLEPAFRADRDYDHPATSAALALAYAAVGRPDDAVTLADQAEEQAAATYADRYQARIASGLAHAQVGRGDDARRRLADAVDIADSTDDLVARAVARLALAYGLEVLGDDDAVEARGAAEEHLDALGLDAKGWDTAFRLATLRDATGATAGRS